MTTRMSVGNTGVVVVTVVVGLLSRHCLPLLNHLQWSRSLHLLAKKIESQASTPRQVLIPPTLIQLHPGALLQWVLVAFCLHSQGDSVHVLVLVLVLVLVDVVVVVEVEVVEVDEVVDVYGLRM